MNSQEWAEWAVEKYGSLEAAKEIRRQAYRKSREHPNANKGGFYSLKKKDKAALSELSKAAINKRWEKARAAKDTTPGQDAPQS